ncbi:hypothetical protein ES703_117113 [subsurface metagenome]
MKRENKVLAYLFVAFTLALFALIVGFRLGGDNALFLIIGHTAAWVEMIVIFFFRKKPPVELPKE